MDDERIDGPDDLESCMRWGQGYRTCSECGGDCEPEPSAEEGIGVRIIFVCPEHGVHSIVDPFEDQR